MTPTKYESDSENLTGIFVKLKKYPYGEINKHSFGNPHPWYLFGTKPWRRPDGAW